MSEFDLARAEELAAGNLKVDPDQLKRVDKALTALREAGIVEGPSYRIASPYERRRPDVLPHTRQRGVRDKPK
jgi:hypothetical protein